MKRLTISIDELAMLRYVLNDSDFDPVQFSLLCEVAGANGISLTLADSDRGIQERDAMLIKKIHKTFLNIHIPVDPQIVKAALTINPDMVTFVDIAKTDRVRISPLSEKEIVENLPNILPDFKANNISVAAYCYPEINILKQMVRQQMDYVEFDCTEITMAADSNEELVGFDKLNSATLAAAKLGIGVICYGRIDYLHLAGLAGVPHIEDICMGLSILKRAMLVGIDQAVKEAQQQIMFYQRL